MTDLKAMFPHINLSKGAHKEGSGQLCAMELTNFIAGYPHSDQAGPCTCPVIAAFVRGVNDGMSDTDRQRLIPYFERVLGSRGTAEDERARAEYLAMRAVNVFAAKALKRSGFHEHARACRDAKNLNEAAKAAGAVRAAWGSAAWAAEAAAAWAAAAEVVSVEDILETLDGVLAIGPQSTWTGTIPANLGDAFKPRVKVGAGQ